MAGFLSWSATRRRRRASSFSRARALDRPEPAFTCRGTNAGAMNLLSSRARRLMAVHLVAWHVSIVSLQPLHSESVTQVKPYLLPDTFHSPEVTPSYRVAIFKDMEWGVSILAAIGENSPSSPDAWFRTFATNLSDVAPSHIHRQQSAGLHVNGQRDVGMGNRASSMRRIEAGQHRTVRAGQGEFSRWPMRTRRAPDPATIMGAARARAR